MVGVSVKKSAAGILFLMLASLVFAGGSFEDRGPLSKVTFIHYKDGHNRVVPDARAGGNSKGGSTCYTFLAKDTKWKNAEDYAVNPANSDGLSQSFILSSLNSGVTAWETTGGSRNIFGSGTIDDSAAYNTVSTDEKNTVSFGAYSDSGVIAVTTVWGYFYGPPSTRELVEWDMLFNDLYSWGDASVSGAAVMDLQNIATHELGHSAGLGDLYNAACLNETMYGYSSNGETKKRDLNTGDIKGITLLYSA